MDVQVGLVICSGGCAGIIAYKISASKIIAAGAALCVVITYASAKLLPIFKKRKRALDDLQELVNIVNSPTKENQNYKSVSQLKYGFALNLALAAVEDQGSADQMFRDRINSFEKLSKEQAGFPKAYRFLKFAAAAYGPAGSGMFMMGLGSILLGGSERTFVAKFLDIPEKDILFHHSEIKWNEKARFPKHFIALDHASQAIILSVRGTFNINDVITCLLAHPSEFCGGIAHSGMVSAARELAKFAVSIIRKAVQQYPKYEVILCGHSLGGGTAILLSILLDRISLLQGVNMRCFAFAPPPVFAPLDVLKTNVSSRITSYILEDDFVTRCSLASVHRLVSRVSRIDQLNLSFMDRVGILRRGDRSLLSLSMEDVIFVDCESSVSDLHIPGELVWIHSGMYWRILEGGRSAILRDLELSPSCVQVHPFSSYLDALSLSA
jgi:hypothetical protein